MANTDNTTRPREALVSRQYSYKEFMSCQPINFKGTEGAVGLIRWFERIESMFSCSNCTEDLSPPPLVAKPKKRKSQIVALTLTKSPGPEASGALSKNRKQPKSKTSPTKTKESSPKPTEGFEQSHSVSSGTILDPQDLKRDIQLASTGLPSTLDEEPLKLQTYADIQAFLLSNNELDKDSDEEEVLVTRDDIDEDPQDDKEVRTPSTKQDQPEPSDVQQSASDSSSPDLKKFDNILPLTERQLIKYLRKMPRASVDQYYDENIAHRDQTDKLLEASMSSLDRSSTTISDLCKGLNVIT
ncbi:hypothetical protein Tco_1234308 [Tanacetum coccineum]